MTPALVEAQSLSVRYAGAPALRDVTLRIARGEIVTVVGPNGSGKSTLVKALLGVLAPSVGHVTRQVGLRIGYVPQRLSIDPAMPLTVARFLSVPVRQPPAAVAAVLARAGISGMERKALTALSGGQFQRALLARALLTEPDLLILDEPTQGLDAPGISQFYKLIAELRSEIGCAVLMVSHDLHVVMRASDRVICLNGHICCQGPPSTVLEAPEYRALFGPGVADSLALYGHKHDHSHDHSHGVAPH